MAKTVKIPDNMRPWEATINGIKYVYPAGTTQEVPDEVAGLIERLSNLEPEKEPIAPPFAGGGMGGADWNAAEGEPGHVLNRTHWVEENGVLLEETDAVEGTDPTFGKIWMIAKALILTVGETYTIIYNGVPYDCMCYPGDVLGSSFAKGGFVMGNFSVVGGANTGEPFAMVISPSSQMIMNLDLTGATSVRIGIMGEVYHKLDTNFLPVLVVKFVEREDGNLVSTSHTYQQMKNAIMDGAPVVCIVKYSDGLGGSTAFLSCGDGDSLIIGVKHDAGLQECTWFRAFEYPKYYLDNDTDNKTIGNELWWKSGNN